MGSRLRSWLVVAICAALVFSLAGCGTKTETADAPAEGTTATTSEEPIRVALGGIITPKSAKTYYNDLLTYVGKKVGREIELLEEEDYTAINSLMEKKQCDVGFVCAGPYTDAHDSWGMELLVAPQVNNDTVYYSYFIVPIDSTAKSMEDLKGKTFAFTDPKSNTGKLVPTFVLARDYKTTPEAWFGKTYFTKGHDKSIAAVANGEADGAAVDSLIWEYQNATDPTDTSKTKIIFKSDPWGIPPVAVHPDMDPVLKKALQDAFMGMADDPEGAAILKKMNIQKWVEIDDSKYDSVRAMNKWIADNPLQ